MRTSPRPRRPGLLDNVCRTDFGSGSQSLPLIKGHGQEPFRSHWLGESCVYQWIPKIPSNSKEPKKVAARSRKHPERSFLFLTTLIYSMNVQQEGQEVIHVALQGKENRELQVLPPSLDPYPNGYFLHRWGRCPRGGSSEGSATVSTGCVRGQVGRHAGLAA